jgi:hypothetical protein
MDQIFRLTDNQKAKIKLLIKIKLWVITVGFFFILSEAVLGVRDLPDISTGLLGAFFSGAITLLLKRALNKGRANVLLVHLSFIFDALLIAAAVYANGNIETVWAFAPVFITYMSAYVFGVWAGIFYALYICLIFTGTFTLELVGILPHVPTYGIPNLYTMDLEYFKDALLGLYLMHFITAVSVGSLSRTTDMRNEKIDAAARSCDESAAKKAKLANELEITKRILDDKIREIDRNRKAAEGRDAEIAQVQAELDAIEGGKA